jgi:outer membrane biosynthesis protein TonB
MESEKKNKRIGMITSLGLHGLLALLFILSMAWRAPDPPLPEFGIELNFGMDTEGSGEEPIVSPTATDNEQSEPETEEAESTPVEPVQEEQPADDQPLEEVVTSKQESEVVVKEEKEKVKEEVKKHTPEKPKEEVKKVEPEKVKVEYKKDDVKSTDKPTDTQGNQPLSEGDDKDKTNDKGDPKGKLDPNASYTGTPGGGAGGDGLSLSMTGWAWADEPKIDKISDTQAGRIRFEIECDENGDIVSVRSLERGLSPRTEQMLKDAIQNSSLMRQGGTKAPPRSKGTVTFELKVR